MLYHNLQAKMEQHTQHLGKTSLSRMYSYTVNWGDKVIEKVF